MIHNANAKLLTDAPTRLLCSLLARISAMLLVALIAASCVSGVGVAAGGRISRTLYCNWVPKQMLFGAEIALAVITVIFHAFNVGALLYIYQSSGMICVSMPWRKATPARSADIALQSLEAGGTSPARQGRSPRSSTGQWSAALATEGLGRCIACSAITVIAILLSEYADDGATSRMEPF